MNIFIRFFLIGMFFISLSPLFLKVAIAKNNRFLITKDFSAIHNAYVINRSFQSGSIAVSFYIKNVSNSGISLLVMPRQAENFQVNHMYANRCSNTKFSGVPLYPERRKFDESLAKRIAVYIPEGDGLFVTVTRSGCHFIGQKSFHDGMIKNGIVSGNLTVIKGRRILTRPISGRF